MKQILLLSSVISFSCSILLADPIGHIVRPFPEGTVLYKTTGARLITLSPTKIDAKTGSKSLKFAFHGKWELNPELQGVSVKPEAGVVIIADTDEEEQKLAKIESMLRAKGSKRIDIYVLSGSVNRDHVSYVSPETIRFD